MRRYRNYFRSAPLLLLLAGCNQGTVHVTESTPERHVVVEERHPAPAIEVVVDVEEDDVSYVVYREYYECSDEEITFIPYYRRYYLLDDCDLFFLFHVARHTHRPIDIVIRSYYYDCGRDYDRLIVTYRVDRSIFFVNLPGSYHPDGHFDRPYRLYREHGMERARFTNVEFRALVSLKIGVEYQGVRPEQVVERIREQPSAPHRAILRSRESLGSGGRNVQGNAVTVKAPRPWTMPEKEKQNLRQDRRQKAVVREKEFEGKHGQRVEEVRQVEGKGREKDPKNPRDVEREKDPKNPRDVEREKDPKNPRDVEREKDPKNPRDVEREKDPKSPKDVEREKDPKSPKDVEREKDPKNPKDAEREKDPKNPKDVEREKDPKSPKDVEREKDPKNPKDVEREKDLERQKQLEREQQLEREKELERQRELERQKDHERKKSPKDPK